MRTDKEQELEIQFISVKLSLNDFDDVVSMKTISWKKLKKIDILIKENISDWFQQMKSHLHDELQWKIIQDVMIKQEHKAVKNTARISEEMPIPEQEIPESTPESGNIEALIRLSDDKIWDLKNWKTISSMMMLLKSLDHHLIRKIRFVKDIWIYLMKYYK